MNFDPHEMIDALKMEIQLIRDGAYNPSVREPRREPRQFRDSVTCLNVGLREKREPCERCFLSLFVPPEHLDKREACHFIPLNEAGDTIDSLSREPDREKRNAMLLAWLNATIARLEKEVAVGK